MSFWTFVPCFGRLFEPKNSEIDDENAMKMTIFRLQNYFSGSFLKKWSW